MPSGIRVAFVYPFHSTFIQKDEDILGRSFDVRPTIYRGKGDSLRLMRSALTSDLSFSWFALSHADLAVSFSRLFGRGSVVITGGWDVVSIPELGYGEMRNPRRVRKTRRTLKRADRVLAVSESNKRDVLKWVDDVDVDVVYHGFDSDEFSPLGEKENLVLCVAGISRQTLKVKGLETFVETARRLKDVDFVLVGRDIDGSARLLKEHAPPNLSIQGYSPKERLIQHFQKAKVYAQLSAQESFGCSVAEAMLCECVPVVTRRGALPEVCGESALFVEYGDADDAADAVEKALVSDLGPRARGRITSRFPLQKREETLRRIVIGLCDKTAS